MLQADPEHFREELERHVQRLQALKQEVREYGVPDRFQALFAQIESKINRLVLDLSEARHKPWSVMKAELEGAWNSFITDFEVLKLRVQDALNEQEKRR